jgi:hypothetical protein
MAIALAGLAEFALSGPFVFVQMPEPMVMAPGGMPPERVSAMLQLVRSMMLASLVLAGILGLVVTALMIVGAAKRWNWMFWVSLVIYGLPITVLPFALLGLVGVRLPAPAGEVPAPVPQIPAAVRVSGYLLNFAQFVLVAVMLVVAVRIGPWACRRVLEEDLDVPPPAGQTHRA